MISYALILAVCIAQTTKTVSHDTHDFSYSPVHSQEVTILEGSAPLPSKILFQFGHEEEFFNLTLQKVVNYGFYYTGQGEKFIDEVWEPIDYARFLFVDKTISGVWSGVVGHDGVTSSFKRNVGEGADEVLVIGYSTRHTASRRNLQQMDEFDNCWPGQATTTKEIEIGYVVDPEFSAAAIESQAANTALTNKEKVMAAVMKISDETNSIYRPQLGIEMILDPESIIDQEGLFDEQMTSQFPLGCSANPSISGYLQSLAGWRSSVKSGNKGLWKLLTDCFPPPGTIGIAYVGTLCRNYGVGVTTWTGDRTWQTDAHEIGHIFGAGHSFEEGQGSTGGIMDYGDGLLNGVYQFNEQYRKFEMCGIISSTMESYPECWATLSLDGTQWFDWVRATDASDVNTLGECLPLKGQYRYKTTQYLCERTDATGTTVVDNDFCSLVQKPYQNHESHQISNEGCSADITGFTCGNGFIDPGEECESNLPTGNPAGNCCVNCQWSTTPECIPQSTNVDAAAVHNGILYMFTNDLVYRFSSVDAINADSGYPRSISTAFPGLAATSFTENIGAAAIRPGSNVLYLYQGLDFVAYDLSLNMVTETGDISNSLSTTPENCGRVDAAVAFSEHMFLFCESVFNIVPYGGSWTHFRPAHDLEFEWPQSVRNFLSAAAHDEITGTTLFWNSGQRVKWFGGAVHEPSKSISGLGLQVVDPDSTSNCPINCKNCDETDSTICTACDPGYVLRGTTCRPNNVYAFLQFNYSGEDDDAEYVSGGQNTLNSLNNNGKYVSGITANDQALFFDGSDRLNMKPINRQWNTKMAISAYFKPSAYLGEQQTFLTLRDGNTDQLIIKFGQRDACPPPTGCSCIETTVIVGSETTTVPASCGTYGLESNQPYCYVSPGCASAQTSTYSSSQYAVCPGLDCSNLATSSSSQFDMEVTIGENSFTCFVSTPIQLNQWNQLTFEFDGTTFMTGVNGMTHTRAYVEAGTGGFSSTQFYISDWSLGHTTDGIYGSVDMFALTFGDIDPNLASSVGNSDSGAASGGAIAAGILLPLMFIAVVVLAWYFREELSHWYYTDRKKDITFPTAPAPTSTGSTVQKQYQGRPSFNISRNQVNLEWYYVDASDKQFGPFTDYAFQNKLGTAIKEDMYVWNGDSVADWTLAKDVPELKNKLTVRRMPPRGPPKPPKAVDTRQWHYVDRNNDSKGPVGSEVMRRYFRMKIINAETLVWNESMADWAALKATDIVPSQ